MFSRFAEDDVRPTLLGQGEIYLCRRYVNELIAMIASQVVVRLALEVSQHLLIATLDPARRCHIYRLKLALHFVFIAQAMRHHFKLQRSDSAPGIRSLLRMGLNKLCCPLFTELRQAFLQAP